MKQIVYFALAAGLLFPLARADEFNKKILVTVKQSVQVPGKTLQPGTYIFRLQDSLTDRDVVQIYNRQESQLLQTVQAFPDYRLVPASNVTIQLEERAVGEPPAIKAIFFPGDNYGQAFVYPRVQPTTAIAVTQHPIQTVAQAAPPPPPEAPPAPEAAPEETPPPPPPEVAEREKVLPHSASDNPLILLIGFLSVAAAGGMEVLMRANRGA